MAVLVACLSLAAGIVWTVWSWQATSRAVLFAPGILCALLSCLCVTGAVVDARRRRTEPIADLEDDLALLKLSARGINAAHPPSLKLQRSVYREDVALLVEQYEADSLRYRSIHN
ncbi:hypothetical protein [Streptomyces sp. NPDC051561]|uniref:hypothetical protein n=1 Tax=Streptomyces sp. NPDC051561 TaxID=3365658 RepID=UPI0037BA2832